MSRTRPTQLQPRHNASLAASEASVAAQALDAKQWEAFTQKQNVPGFLLLDAVRFYKRGQAVRDQLVPAVENLRKETDGMKRNMDVLLQDLRSSQKGMGNIQNNLNVITIDLGTMSQDIDTVRRDNLRTNAVGSKNGQDIGDLIMKLDALEREIISLRARERDNIDFRAELTTLVGDLSAMVVALKQQSVAQTQVQAKNSQRWIEKDVQRSLDVQSKQTPTRYIGNFSQNSALTQINTSLAQRLPVQSLSQPTLQTGNRGESFTSLGFENAVPARNDNLAFNYVDPRPASQSQASQSQRAYITLSEDSGTETVSLSSDKDDDAPESSAHSEAPTAVLTRLLNQANAQYPHRQRKDDRVFMWTFLDAIEDKELGKRLQLFLLDYFKGKKLVTATRKSCQWMKQKNRFVCLSKLTWLEFVDAVGRFQKRELTA